MLLNSSFTQAICQTIYQPYPDQSSDQTLQPRIDASASQTAAGLQAPVPAPPIVKQIPMVISTPPQASDTSIISSPDYSQTTNNTSGNTAIASAQLPGGVPSIAGLFLVLGQLDSQMQAQNDQASGQAGGIHKVSQRTKSMSGMVLGFQGFDPSKQGANIALDEGNGKGYQAIEYFNQKQNDEKHSKVVSAIMDLACGLGMQESKQSNEVVARSLENLHAIIDYQEAENIVTALETTRDLLASKQYTMPQEAWSIDKRDRLLKQIIDSLTASDPVVTDCVAQLHKYNTLSEACQNSAKTIGGVLGIASFIPTIVAPIADISKLAFTSTTGGPEQEKLLKEIYYSKTLQHRLDMINSEASMIMDSYFMALATNNMVLLSASRSLLEHATGATSPAVCDMYNAQKQVAGKVIRYAPYNPPQHYQPYVSDKAVVPGS